MGWFSVWFITIDITAVLRHLGSPPRHKGREADHAVNMVARGLWHEAWNIA